MRAEREQDKQRKAEMSGRGEETGKWQMKA